MIKFFRKIRRQLMEEKKLGNYLLYAVGEILLVVIGILIALAINNGNENRITRAKEQVYLSGLSEEFQSSQLKLEELMRVNKKIYESAEQIVGYISDQNSTPTEREFSTLLYQSFAFDISFNPNNALLREMINSGSLKDISNAELRKRLANWLSFLEDITKQEHEQNIQRERVIDLFRTSEHSIRTIFDLTNSSGNEPAPSAEKPYISNLNLLQSTEFENNLLMFLITSQSTEVSHYQPLLRELEVILELIGSEVKD